MYGLQKIVSKTYSLIPFIALASMVATTTACDNIRRIDKRTSNPQQTAPVPIPTPTPIPAPGETDLIIDQQLGTSVLPLKFHNTQGIAVAETGSVEITFEPKSTSGAAQDFFSFVASLPAELGDGLNDNPTWDNLDLISSSLSCEVTSTFTETIESIPEDVANLDWALQTPVTSQPRQFKAQAEIDADGSPEKLVTFREKTRSLLLIDQTDADNLELYRCIIIDYPNESTTTP